MSLRVHEMENTVFSIGYGAPPCFDVFCQISLVIFSDKRQVPGGQDFPQESGFVLPFEHFLRPGQGALGVHPAPTTAIGLSLSQLSTCHHPESVIDLTTCVPLKHVFHRSTHVCQNLFTLHTITNTRVLPGKQTQRLMWLIAEICPNAIDFDRCLLQVYKLGGMSLQDSYLTD